MSAACGYRTKASSAGAMVSRRFSIVRLNEAFVKKMRKLHVDNITSLLVTTFLRST
jgi:hypothetical protein